MLTRLNETLGRWRPSGSAASDPLATIRSAWSEIVGADVARAAQPVAITGSAVVVVTASPSWSHQLSFLEREILRMIAELGVGGIERLRFRVGTIRAPRLPVAEVRRRRRGTPTPAAPGPGPRTPEEALARLRAVVEARRAEHGAAGGRFCTACGGAIAGGERCRPCRDTAERRVRDRCERVLFEAPWLDPEAVLDAVPGLDAAGYDAIRRDLLRRWIDELRLARRRFAVKVPIDAVRIRRLASSYVLLETRLDPNRLELESPVRKNALGDLYDFIREVETRE